MREPADALRSLKKYVSMALSESGEHRWEVRLAFEEGTFRRPFARVEASAKAVATGPAHRVEWTQPFTVLCHPVETTSADEAVLAAARISTTLGRAFRVGAGAPLPAPTLPVATGAAGALPAGSYSYAVTAVGRDVESPPGRVDIVLAATGGVTLTWPQVRGCTGYRVYRDELIIATVSGLTYTDVGAAQGTGFPRALGLGTLGQPMRVPLWDWDDVPLTETTDRRGYADFMRVVDVSVGEIVDPADDLRRAVACDVRLRWAQQGRVPVDRQTLTGVRLRQNIRM